ncbi:hypothetical protein ABN764_04550 [Paenibacillaceae sp. P-4]
MKNDKNGHQTSSKSEQKGMQPVAPKENTSPPKGGSSISRPILNK